MGDRRAQRLDQPAVGQQRRVHAVGQRPQLLQRLLGGCLELADASCRAKRILREHVLHDAQLDAQRDEPLLRAVVEIALDPSPLVVGAGGDARARLADGRGRSLGLRLEAPVVACDGDERGPDRHQGTASADAHDRPRQARRRQPGKLGWVRSGDVHDEQRTVA